MSRIHLTDRQWAFIRPLLPPPAPTGRPRADDRRTIEGIVYILITGSRWQDLPRDSGYARPILAALARLSCALAMAQERKIVGIVFPTGGKSLVTGSFILRGGIS
jgi:hypothetical protein